MDTVIKSTVREKAVAFLQLCQIDSSHYSLTPQAEPTPYARCFAIYLMHLLRSPQLTEMAEVLAAAVIADVRGMRASLGKGSELQGKPYRQLLTFSLSALALLPARGPQALNDLVLEQLPDDIAGELTHYGCLDGVAGSGNQAMFQAVFLLHARDYIGKDTGPKIDQWVSLHLSRINYFGFWGKSSGMTHLQFQNGYHQHEILEYLGIDSPKMSETLVAMRTLADGEGHFAPYPGGGGCYDYDAIFMLTPNGRIPDEQTQTILLQCAKVVAQEQRTNGGFAESVYIRPRTVSNLGRSLSHVGTALGNGPLFKERLRYALTLQRPKHDTIHTHWSRYSRRWDEADLWDTWFRLLLLARIDVALNPKNSSSWGFINYPGIGYHPSLRQKKTEL